MRTTLTLLGNRVAQPFDYADGKTRNGENIRVGPAKIGGVPLCVDFDERDNRILNVVDMDKNAPARNLDPQAVDAIRAFIAKQPRPA